MKRRHFETLRPVCPVCLHEKQTEAPLRLAAVTREQGDIVFEGILHCGDSACQREYPIIDGLPLLIPNLRSYISEQLLPLLARDDLAADLESLVGDCCGPGSAFEINRHYLSCYVWDHYGEFDPERAAGSAAAGGALTASPAARPGSVARLLGELIAHVPPAKKPILDVGCSVGRGTFTLAEHFNTLILGVDHNLSMMRCAARVLHQGTVRYARKRVGLAYDRRDFPVSLPVAELVDFWVCDMLAPPFVPKTFGGVVGLNVLDCIAAPMQFLERGAPLLDAAGFLALTTPYDWTANIPVEAWLGGHSQRGPNQGSSEPILRGLLTPGTYPQSLPGFRIVADLERLPWHVRLHERSVMEYLVHGVVARKE